MNLASKRQNSWNRFERMNRSLSEKEGNKEEYFREREQHLTHTELCKGLVCSGGSRDIWHGKDRGVWQGKLGM